MRTPPASRQEVSATAPRTPGTRRSPRSSRRSGQSWRSAGSTPGGPPRRAPPRPAPTPRDDFPSRGPPGEAADPLARLAPSELRDRLAHHVLELRYPILDDVGDQGLQVVELLARGRHGLLGGLVPALPAVRPRRSRRG